MNHKFRVWHNTKKEWLHEGISLFGETILLGAFMPVSLEELNDCEAHQYTGQNDINNKEVYEGDIIKVKRCHTVARQTNPGSVAIDLIEDKEEIGHVFWCDYMGHGWRVSFAHIRYDDYEELGNNEDRIEVIGNIKENPELVSYE